MILARLLVRPACQIRTLASKMGEEGTIYGFTAKDSDGAEVSLDRYKGKVVIIVNTASACGFTNSNYTQLKVCISLAYKNHNF